MPVPGLLLGTAQGLYSVSLGPGASATARLAGLQGRLVNHVAAAALGGGGAAACLVAAAVPRLQTGEGQLHRMLGAEQLGEDASGLHLLRPASEDADAAWTSERVWSGDARSCGAWPVAGGSGMHLAVGSEPADVFCSQDGGGTWSAGTDSFAALDSRPQWTFPPPPHQPHVLSLERLASGQVRWAAEAPGQQPVPSPAHSSRRCLPVFNLPHRAQLVAGIEVGGVLVSTDASAGSWEEKKGVYADVHRCEDAQP